MVLTWKEILGEDEWEGQKVSDEESERESGEEEDGLEPLVSLSQHQEGVRQEREREE